MTFGERCRSQKNIEKNGEKCFFFFFFFWGKMLYGKYVVGKNIFGEHNLAPIICIFHLGRCVIENGLW